MKANVAQYFGLEKAYNSVRSSSNREVGYLKTVASWEDLKKLEEIELITIEGGKIILS